MSLHNSQVRSGTHFIHADGTNHFVHAGTPADKACNAEYEAGPYNGNGKRIQEDGYRSR